MKCPHCLEFFAENWRTQRLGTDEKPDAMSEELDHDRELYGYQVDVTNCRACGQLITTLYRGQFERPGGGQWYMRPGASGRFIVPQVPSRTRFAGEIPPEFKQDYDEAAAVLPVSPQASAALSRRCLQNIIRNRAGITEKSLYHEIEALLESRTLPSFYADYLHRVREMGNIGAHPITSETTAEIVRVEPDEAEICLAAVEGLFDFYFIQPLLHQEQLSRLDRKIQKTKKSTASSTPEEDDSGR
ncbi:MAG TPA: DUF4145 domain-containing protein [Acidobacteriota bacterium]|nr:DUF4145 domain-containing protein [Acidobacteriota bacterium]